MTSGCVWTHRSILADAHWVHVYDGPEDHDKWRLCHAVLLLPEEPHGQWYCLHWVIDHRSGVT